MPSRGAHNPGRTDQRNSPSFSGDNDSTLARRYQDFNRPAVNTQKERPAVGGTPAAHVDFSTLIETCARRDRQDQHNGRGEPESTGPAFVTNVKPNLAGNDAKSTLDNAGGHVKPAYGPVTSNTKPTSKGVQESSHKTNLSDNGPDRPPPVIVYWMDEEEENQVAGSTAKPSRNTQPSNTGRLNPLSLLQFPWCVASRVT